MASIPFPRGQSQRRTEGRSGEVLTQITESPIIDAVIVDGAFIIQMLPTRTMRTFDEYFEAIFAPYVMKQLESVSRVDLVWYVFIADSLKGSAQEK